MNVTFDDAPPPGHINFGVGQPSADLLPVQLIEQASADFLRAAQPFEFNYGERQGDRRFRESLAAFLSRHYGLPALSESLLVTAGNSQALAFVATQLTRPGDTVFVEEPSYFLAFNILRDHGVKLVGIPVDENGMIIEQLEAELQAHKPSLVYTIPSYHNPTGRCMSTARRHRLVELSLEHGFVVAADEVYQLLHYYEPPPVAFGSLAEQQGGDGSIVSMGSFSKILAPGLRLGWIQTSEPLLQRLMANGVVSSGGSLSHFSSQVVRHAIDLGLQDQHLEHLRKTYRERVEAMDRALHKHLGHLAHWHKPEGGYFFWLEMPEDFDAAAMRILAPNFKTGFQAGSISSTKGQFSNCIRLSFAHYNEEQICDGICRVAELISSNY
jgi:DNA-binding transcriptional MocR family regulator